MILIALNSFDHEWSQSHLVQHNKQYRKEQHYTNNVFLINGEPREGVTPSLI